MRTYLPFTVALLAISALLAYIPATAPIDKPSSSISKEEKEAIFLQEGAVIGLHFMRHKTNHDVAENRQFLEDAYFPNWRDLMPGSRVHYLRGDRGPNTTKEVFFWVFQSQADLDRYFPKADTPSDAYKSRRETIDWLYTDTTFYKHNAGWENELSADYRVISAGVELSQNWLQANAMISLRHMKLKPGIDTTAFEAFMADTWGPNRSDAVPGSKAFFLQGISGGHKGEYALLWVLESVETRNKYFPEENQSSEVYRELQEMWSWLDDEVYGGQYVEGWDEAGKNDYFVVL
ncbi:MAG: hypothetical protein KTR30_35945 [Saprospiraceae bacterium]|nr:hypothetical protein [Saprospiraceae bacterium]